MPISIKYFGKPQLSRRQIQLLIKLGAKGYKLMVFADDNFLCSPTPMFPEWVPDDVICSLIEAGLLICYSPAPETYQWILSSDGVQWVANELSARRTTLPQPDVLWDLN